MSSEPLRWGILGTGRILTKFAEAFRLARGVALVAVASRDEARAKAAAKQFGISRAHTGYDALLADREVDVVINALHNGLHCEWTVRALEAGKHVLCEKPLACSSEEVDRMFSAARRCGRQLMEGFMYRFHPQMAEVKRRLAAGEIGQPVHIRAIYCGLARDRQNPRYRVEQGGGALMDVGCYCVNFARLAAGAEPVSATARARFDGAGGVDLTLAGALEFAGGLTAHVAASFEAEGAYGAEVIGTQGRLFVPHPWLPPKWPAEIEVTRAGKTETVRVQSADAPQHFLAPFALELEHFADCVRQDRAPSVVSEADSRGNVRALESLLTSARRAGRMPGQGG
jgi:predicted dehydrogenase